MALRADVLLNLLETSLIEPNLTALRAHPGLAWMEPRLARWRDDLREVLGAAKATDRRAALKAEVARCDAEHDAWHRFAWRALSAWQVYPDAAVAEAVRGATEVLYPDGLSLITVGFRRQVAATEPFAERMQQPQVRAGLAALGAASAQVLQALNAAVASGRALGIALQALDAEEVSVSLRDPEARVFEVRAGASAEYSLFLRNAEAILARGDKAQVHAWSLLSRPWRQAREAARKQNAASTTADLDALLGPGVVPGESEPPAAAAR